MANAARKRFRIDQDDRRSVLTRHLLGAVEPLLADGTPYADLSVETLIRAAGIARSTFYAYYDDKGAALEAMAFAVISELLPVGERWYSLPATADRADLRRALQGPIDTYRNHRAIFAAVTEAAPHDPRIRAQQTRLVEGVIASLAGHIKAGQQGKTIAPDLDPEDTARWLIWMIERGLYQFLGDATPKAAAAAVDHLTEIIWRILYEGYRPAAS